MPDIFLSYAREDIESARSLYGDLMSAGFAVWIDKVYVGPGYDWKVEIEKAIRISKVFITCLSSRSVNKRGFVQAELQRALEMLDQMPEGDVYLIPVRLD